MKVKPNDFQNALNELLKDYGDECSRKIEEVLPAVGKEAQAKVKTSAQQQFKKHKARKSYLTGWALKVEKKGMHIKVYVYNKKAPQLTHLLENGHNVANGRGATGYVPGRPHIAPANDWAQKEVIERLEKEL